MTRWLQAAKAALPPADKTDETDKTGSGCAQDQHKSTSDGVLSVVSVLSGGGRPVGQPNTDTAAAPHADDAYQHGRGVNGDPKTWTGRIVSLDEWRRLSEWERHGSTGKVWNALTRQWEPGGGAA